MMQVMYALMDQRYHAASAPLEPGQTTAIFHEVFEDCMGMDCPPSIHWQTHFSHLLGYGAGYYSYLYCRMFAAHLWYVHPTPCPPLVSFLSLLPHFLCSLTRLSPSADSPSLLQILFLSSIIAAMAMARCRVPDGGWLVSGHTPSRTTRSRSKLASDCGPASLPTAGNSRRQSPRPPRLWGSTVSQNLR